MSDIDAFYMPSSSPVLAQRRETLLTLAEPLLGFVLTLRNSSDPGQAASVRRHYQELSQSFLDGVSTHGIDSRRAEDALFAISLLIDETILRTHSQAAEDWMAQSLHSEIYGTTTGGTEVFERIDNTMRAGDGDACDLLEIYLHCLALGLRGRHATDPRGEALRALRADLARRITERRARTHARGLSNGATGGGPDDVRQKTVPSWVFVVGFGVLALIILIWTMSSAGGARDELLADEQLAPLSDSDIHPIPALGEDENAASSTPRAESEADSNDRDDSEEDDK